MDPTIAGFQWFIANVMGISSTVLPSTNPAIAFSFAMAQNIVNPQLRCAPSLDPSQPTIYAVAVYNLAADFLISNAQDQTGYTYFTNLRATLGVNAPTTGVLSSTSDASTASSYSIPTSLQNLTIGQLQNMRTPYGRQYLALASSVGSLWGMS